MNNAKAPCLLDSGAANAKDFITSSICTCFARVPIDMVYSKVQENSKYVSVCVAGRGGEHK